MFETKDHNFGTVARGSDTVYKFKIKNIYKEDVHIQSVRSSCGCTSPSIENDLLKTFEEGYIVAKFNTRTHTGNKSATLTVVFDKPYRAQVQLRVHGNIRGDVTFDPGSVSFDSVDQGSVIEKQVEVKYSGYSSWNIQDVVVGNENADFLEVELAEKQRYRGSTKYELLVRLKENAPAGYLKDQLILVSNTGTRIPLDIEGRIVPQISVAPQNVVFGEVAQQATAAKKIVIRGKTAFRITEISAHEGLLFEYDGEQEKPMHIVTVSLNASQAAGSMDEKVQIKTSLGEAYTADFRAFATVTEGTTSGTDSSTEPADESTTESTASPQTGLASDG